MTDMKLLWSTVAIFAISGCSSAPKVGIKNAGKETTVATLNDSSKPSWVVDASERTFLESGDDLVSIGSSSLQEGSRIDAGFKISDLNAKANLAKVMDSKVEHFSQVADEGTDFSGLDLRSITSEVAKISASGMKPGHRFWEKVLVTDAQGVPHLEFRFWSEVRISKEDYKRAVIRAAQAIQGKSALSEKFAAQVNSHFEKIISDTSEPPKAEERKPTNQSDNE